MKHWTALLLALTMLVSLTACGAKEPEAPMSEEPAETVIEETAEEPTDEIPDVIYPAGDEGAEEAAGQAADPYEAVLATYTAAVLEDWDKGRMMDEDLCYMMGGMLADDPRGHAVVLRQDLDGDGMEELILGAKSESMFYDAMIFTLYTQKDGEAVLLAQSFERDRFYLLSDGRIEEESSGSAFDSADCVYEVKNGCLELCGGVRFDSMTNEAQPWSSFENGAWESIDETAANMYREQYDMLRSMEGAVALLREDILVTNARGGAVAELRFAEEGEAQEPGSFVEDGGGSEYACKVAFTCSEDVGQVRYLKVDAQFQEDGEVELRAGEALYCAEELKAGEAMYINLILPEILPDRAISYVDGTGRTVCCLITQSGENGDLILTECELQ